MPKTTNTPDYGFITQPMLPDVALAAFEAAIGAMPQADQVFLRTYLVSSSKDAAGIAANLEPWEGERVLSTTTARRVIDLYCILQDPQISDLRHRLVLSLLNDAFGDPADAFDRTTGAARPIHAISPACRQRITLYKTTRYGVEIQFTNRLKAKELLMQLIGLDVGAGPGLSITINTGARTDEVGTARMYTTQVPERSRPSSDSSPLTLRVGPQSRPPSEMP